MPARVFGESTGIKSQPPPSFHHCGLAAPPFVPAEPEVEARASHDTPRGAYSNCTEKREAVVMAAPEPEVVCPAAVPGKSWGPEIGEP